MKRIIWILILIFLFAGCSKVAAPVVETPDDTPNPNGYMNDPQILIGNGHQYKQESWIGDSTELKDNKIQLQGNSFNVNIIFQGNIPEEAFKNAVRVEGYEQTAAVDITPSEGKTAFYGNYPEIDTSKTYKLVISKDIVDSQGKTLKTDIVKEITFMPDTTALYTFASKEGTYSNLGWQNVMDAFAVGNMNWTSEPKTILIDFSAEVDQDSVEQSIIAGLSGKGAKYSFEWNDTKKLTLKLENLKDGEPEPYMISMAHAKDLEGNQVYGNFFFVTSKHNYLGSIDMKTKRNTEIHKFPDKRYMTIQSGKVNDSIILDDTDEKYVFHIKDKNTSKVDLDREFISGIPGLSFRYSWLDSNTMVLLNRNDGKVISYSTLNGESKILFALPESIIKSNVIEIAASPDGSKLAVAYETLPAQDLTDHDFLIEVFDMSGSSLYKGENLFMPRFMEIFGSIANLKWLNEDTLILEDNLSKENKLDYNVISLDIKSGKKTVVAEHAFKPAVIPSAGLIKIESFEDFDSGKRSIDIFKNGKKIKSFKAASYQYDNFFFSDENTLVYNEGEKIHAYAIDKGKSELIGKGTIIGTSEDGSRVFYITNHRMLYYID